MNADHRQIGICPGRNRQFRQICICSEQQRKQHYTDRQEIARQGHLATYAHYENFSETSGIMFPGIVSIQRPAEGYGITLSIVKLDVNLPLTDEQFALTQPPGSQLINLDSQSSAAAAREEESKNPR